MPKRKGSELNEEGGGATGCCGAIDGMGGDGAAGGAYSAPFGMVRRQMPTEIGESTTTTNTGNYEYTAPAFDKKKCKKFLKTALDRHDGEGGSISINHVEKKKKS